METRDWFRDHPLLTAIILTIMLTFTVGNTYVRLSQELLRETGMEEINVALVSYAIRFIIGSITLFLLVPLLIYQSPRSKRNYVEELKFVPGISLQKIVFCGLLSFSIFAAVSIGILLSLGIFTDDPLSFLKSPSSESGGWLWLVAAINPAVLEEMGFRGVLFSNLERRYSRRRVIGMSSILFGIMHFGGLANGQGIATVIVIAIMATTIGLTWGYMTAKTRSVIPAMMVHYLVNAMADVIQNANTTDESLQLIHILGMTILYPLLSILAIKFVMRNQDEETKHFE